MQSCPSEAGTTYKESFSSRRYGFTLLSMRHPCQRVSQDPFQSQIDKSCFVQQTTSRVKQMSPAEPIPLIYRFVYSGFMHRAIVAVFRDWWTAGKAAGCNRHMGKGQFHTVFCITGRVQLRCSVRWDIWTWGPVRQNGGWDWGLAPLGICL